MRSRLLCGALFFIAGAALVACGIAFAPGDYGSPSSRDAGTGVLPDGAVPFDGDVPPVPDGGARLLLLSGQRERFGMNDPSPYVAETLLTTVNAEGKLGPFVYDRSPPSATTYVTMVLANGTLYAQSGSAVSFAPLGERITDEWKVLPIKSYPPLQYYSPWLLGEKVMVSAGGYTQSGTSMFVTDVYTAPLDFQDAGVDGWTVLPSSKLVKPRGSVTLHRYKKFVYAIGGIDQAFFTNTPGKEDVEVAPLNDDGTPGMFAATEKLVNPSSMTAFGIISPTVADAQGYLFVIGGQQSTQTGSGSDLVLYAKIDEATGLLGKWTGAPRLPGPLTGAAAFSYGGRLFVIGGSGATALSDQVLALTVGTDGKLGDSWERIGVLPASRGGVGVVTY